MIGVVSGKGGVGKSLVTGLLASKMQSRGYQAAVLDADITGPSIPKSFGIHEHARGTEDMLIPCYSNKGTQIMSVNLILDNETDPSFGAVLLLQALLLSSGATCCGMMLTTCLSICLPEQATFL